MAGEKPKNLSEEVPGMEQGFASRDKRSLQGGRTRKEQKKGEGHKKRRDDSEGYADIVSHEQTLPAEKEGQAFSFQEIINLMNDTEKNINRESVEKAKMYLDSLEKKESTDSFIREMEAREWTLEGLKDALEGIIELAPNIAKKDRPDFSSQAHYSKRRFGKLKKGEEGKEPTVDVAPPNIEEVKTEEIETKNEKGWQEQERVYYEIGKSIFENKNKLDRKEFIAFFIKIIKGDNKLLNQVYRVKKDDSRDEKELKTVAEDIFNKLLNENEIIIDNGSDKYKINNTEKVEEELKSEKEESITQGITRLKREDPDKIVEEEESMWNDREERRSESDNEVKTAQSEKLDNETYLKLLQEIKGIEELFTKKDVAERTGISEKEADSLLARMALEALVILEWSDSEDVEEGKKNYSYSIIDEEFNKKIKELEDEVEKASTESVTGNTESEKKEEDGYYQMGIEIVDALSIENDGNTFTLANFKEELFRKVSADEVDHLSVPRNIEKRINNIIDETWQDLINREYIEAADDEGNYVIKKEEIAHDDERLTEAEVNTILTETPEKEKQEEADLNLGKEIIDKNSRINRDQFIEFFIKIRKVESKSLKNAYNIREIDSRENEELAIVAGIVFDKLNNDRGGGEVGHVETEAPAEKKERKDLSEEERAALFDKAVDYIIKQKKATTSLLENEFSISYYDAMHLLDKMEEQEIIGEFNLEKGYSEVLATEHITEKPILKPEPSLVIKQEEIDALREQPGKGADVEEEEKPKARTIEASKQKIKLNEDGDVVSFEQSGAVFKLGGYVKIKPSDTERSWKIDNIQVATNNSGIASITVKNSENHSQVILSNNLLELNPEGSSEELVEIETSETSKTSEIKKTADGYGEKRHELYLDIAHNIVLELGYFTQESFENKFMASATDLDPFESKEIFRELIDEEYIKSAGEGYWQVKTKDVKSIRTASNLRILEIAKKRSQIHEKSNLETLADVEKLVNDEEIKKQVEEFIKMIASAKTEEDISSLKEKMRESFGVFTPEDMREFISAIDQEIKAMALDEASRAAGKKGKWGAVLATSNIGTGIWAGMTGSTGALGAAVTSGTVSLISSARAKLGLGKKKFESKIASAEEKFKKVLAGEDSEERDKIAKKFLTNVSFKIQSKINEWKKQEEGRGEESKYETFARSYLAAHGEDLDPKNIELFARQMELLDKHDEDLNQMEAEFISKHPGFLAKGAEWLDEKLLENAVSRFFLGGKGKATAVGGTAILGAGFAGIQMPRIQALMEKMGVISQANPLVNQVASNIMGPLRALGGARLGKMAGEYFARKSDEKWDKKNTITAEQLEETFAENAGNQTENKFTILARAMAQISDGQYYKEHEQEAQELYFAADKIVQGIIKEATTDDEAMETEKADEIKKELPSMEEIKKEEREKANKVLDNSIDKINESNDEVESMQTALDRRIKGRNRQQVKRSLRRLGYTVVGGIVGYVAPVGAFARSNHEGIEVVEGINATLPGEAESESGGETGSDIDAEGGGTAKIEGVAELSEIVTPPEKPLVETLKVERTWMDNDTSGRNFDENELMFKLDGHMREGLSLGGKNIEFDISGMTPDGSSHGDIKVDVPAELKNVDENGYAKNLRMLITLPGHAESFEVPINGDGKVIIEEDDPLRKLFERGSDRQVSYGGKLEIVQVGETTPDDITKVNVIATSVGTGDVDPEKVNELYESTQASHKADEPVQAEGKADEPIQVESGAGETEKLFVENITEATKADLDIPENATIEEVTSETKLPEGQHLVHVEYKEDKLEKSMYVLFDQDQSEDPEVLHEFTNAEPEQIQGQINNYHSQLQSIAGSAVSDPVEYMQTAEIDYNPEEDLSAGKSVEQFRILIQNSIVNPEEARAVVDIAEHGVGLQQVIDHRYVAQAIDKKFGTNSESFVKDFVNNLPESGKINTPIDRFFTNNINYAEKVVTSVSSPGKSEEAVTFAFLDSNDSTVVVVNVIGDKMKVSLDGAGGQNYGLEDLQEALKDPKAYLEGKRAGATATPTSTPEATDTVAPTETPIPTATAKPSPTPEPTASPTESPTPSPTEVNAAAELFNYDTLTKTEQGALRDLFDNDKDNDPEALRVLVGDDDGYGVEKVNDKQVKITYENNSVVVTPENIQYQKQDGSTEVISMNDIMKFPEEKNSELSKILRNLKTPYSLN